MLAKCQRSWKPAPEGQCQTSKSHHGAAGAAGRGSGVEQPCISTIEDALQHSVRLMACVCHGEHPAEVDEPYAGDVPLSQ